MSKYSIFFTIIFLMIISIISFWLNNEVKKELNIEEKKLTNNPDYFLKNFISKQTDAYGNLNFSLEAKQMNYFSYNDESILKKPVFKKFEEKKKVLIEDGEAAVVGESEEATSQLFRLCIKYSVTLGIRMLASMLRAAHHRRHLMIWKIFAPRFIFEAIGFGVSLVVMCLSYLTFIRIQQSVYNFVQDLTKEK